MQHTGSYRQHNLRRRALAAFLTPQAIQRIEPLIKRHLEQVCQLLTKCQQSQQPAVLSHLYRCMTADIITTYTLGNSYKLLLHPTESEGFLRAFAFTFRLLWLFREIPYLSIVIRWVGKTVGQWMLGDWIIPTLLRWQFVRKNLTLTTNYLTDRYSQFTHNYKTSTIASNLRSSCHRSSHRTS